MDYPPPPYTEMDSSSSHIGRSQAASVGIGRNEASTPSSLSPTMYTPPETPSESHHSFPRSHDHNTVASVHSYFESRPALGQASGQPVVVPLSIMQDSSPDDFPYMAWLDGHDTTEQDWHTFLNYIIPDHFSRANSHIIDRKVRAEDDDVLSSVERSMIEVQLDQIRNASSSPDAHPPHDVDAMIREWNDGFFGPRGVVIQRRAPSHPSSEVPAQQQIPSAESHPQSQDQSNRSWWNPFSPFEATNRGVRLGRLAIDGDRVTFGDRFEVDRNGVRFAGQSIGGNPAFPLPGFGIRGPFQPAHPNPSDPNDLHPGRGFGDSGRRCQGPSGSQCHGPRDHRHGSKSSHSSSSSDSGSDVSSIGSLPDWDDLRDSQLPVTKQSVSAWLAHPEQPVTRAMLRAARSDIKAARQNRGSCGGSSSSSTTADAKAQMKALRQEVRALLNQFKVLKREQRKAARSRRKERREQKRQDKRERRDQHRAEKRERKTAERGCRRAEREAERNARRAPGAGAGIGVDVPLHPRLQYHARTIHPTRPLVPGLPLPLHNVLPYISGPPHLRAANAAREEAARTADAARAEAARTADAARVESERAANAARVESERATNAARAESEKAVYAAHAQATAAVDAARAEAARAVNSVHGRGDEKESYDVTEIYDKYQTANSLEASMLAKTDELKALLAREQGGEKEDRGQFEEKGQEKEKLMSEALKEVEALENEIEDLRKTVQRIWLEADEELARQMERQM
ncbi:hypothetical protein GGR54DRAFT_637577 [Hypoxylon sp. NC1633]|nr:hypothetical protein GGR54DRAFT_637577 [Hypoxylon sp. NC1633]